MAHGIEIFKNVSFSMADGKNLKKVNLPTKETKITVDSTRKVGNVDIPATFLSTRIKAQTDKSDVAMCIKVASEGFEAHSWHITKSAQKIINPDFAPNI